MESRVIAKVRCPHCARHGKDTSQDNLAVYDDGHKYCYSCGYVSHVNKIVKMKKDIENHVFDYKTEVVLPPDCNTEYPARALEWCAKYELTTNDLLANNVFWSEVRQRLIFPIYAAGKLIAWQGRSFFQGDFAVARIPKWKGYGNLKDTFHFVGNEQSKVIVIVEDVVSAIKVSKIGFIGLPLFGSFIGIDRWRRLKYLFNGDKYIFVWLDPDKWKDAIEETKLGQMSGLRCGTIYSSKDPKEHTYKEINNLLDRNLII